MLTADKKFSDNFLMHHECVINVRTDRQVTIASPLCNALQCTSMERL